MRSYLTLEPPETHVGSNSSGMQYTSALLLSTTPLLIEVSTASLPPRRRVARSFAVNQTYPRFRPTAKLHRL